jgi:hypothetical protein
MADSSLYYLEKFYQSDESIQTTNRGQEWFLDQNWKDKLVHDGKSWWVNKKNARTRIDAESVRYNEDDGVWEGKPTSSDKPQSFRINVATTNDKAWNKNEQLNYGKNWKELAKNRGYIVGPEDFRNFEATIYWKRIGDWKHGPRCDKPDQMTIYGRGGLHDKGWPGGCLGCCYKGSIDYNRAKNLAPGSSYFEKEYHHYGSSEGYSERIYQDKSMFTVSQNPNDDLSDKWIGEKFLVYDTDDTVEDGILAVRCEIWVDKNAEQSMKDPAKQDWELMNVFVDKGDKFPPKDDQLANQMVKECNAISKEQVFAWGGPIVSFRIDCTDLQVKYASIREITPPTKAVPLPQ